MGAGRRRAVTPSAEVFALHAQFCKVFSNPTRLRVMWELQQGERMVTHLADAIGVSLANLSQHLRVMRTIGVVAVRREGQSLYYRTASPHFFAGCTCIRQGIMEVMTRQPRLRK
jgi:DNA-binding transcriptional ArsR family regulator